MKNDEPKVDSTDEQNKDKTGITQKLQKEMALI